MTCADHIVSALTIHLNELPLMINYQFNKQMHTFKPHKKDKDDKIISRRNDYILLLYY